MGICKWVEIRVNRCPIGVFKWKPSLTQNIEPLSRNLFWGSLNMTLTWSQENGKLWKYKIICPMGECFSILLAERICTLGSGGIQDNITQDKKCISSGCCCCAECIKTAKLMVERAQVHRLWPSSGQNFLAGLCLADGSWAAGNTEFPAYLTHGCRKGKSGFLAGYWYCGSRLPGLHLQCSFWWALLFRRTFFFKIN